MENKKASGYSDEIDFSELLKVLLKRKWVIIAFTLITLSISILLNLFVLPPIYEAKGVLMVVYPEERLEHAGEELIMERLAQKLAALPPMTLETYVGQLKNEPLLESMAKKLKFDEKKYTLKYLKKKITVDIVSDTNLIEIKVKDKDPARAALMVNTLIENFQEFIAEKNRERMGQSQKIFREQLVLIEKELVQAKKNLNDFLGKPRNISYLEQELKTKQEALTNNQRALAQTQNETFYVPIIRRLENEIQQLHTELLEKQWEYQRLTQEIERLEYNYNLFANQITQTRIFQSIDLGQSNIMIVTEATEPTIPVGPEKERNIVITMVVSLILGVSLAFIMELFDNKVIDAEDVKQHLDLPVVGKIPRIKFKNNNGYLITAADPKSPEAEAFRILRTNLYYENLNQGLRKFLVTSAGCAEGKSTVAVNLANVVAQTGKKVLLIDADMRKPTLHQIFEVDNLGLADYLEGERALEEIIQKTKLASLDIITGGKNPLNPSELLGSDKLNRLFVSLDDYDYIFLDSPPVIPVTDALVLAEKVDGILMVINSKKMPVHLARQTVELLQKSQTKLIGVILNNVRFTKGYYRYYHNGERK
ncbi:MAG: polysaccharide biosynthesis tyrosine autokinase [Clostridia bacterium]|nr:polysaccharide biosynthesis tyrosine autokinase [Clostridia bacterium]